MQEVKDKFVNDIHALRAEIYNMKIAAIENTTKLRAEMHDFRMEMYDWRYKSLKWKAVWIYVGMLVFFIGLFAKGFHWFGA